MFWDWWWIRLATDHHSPWLSVCAFFAWASALETHHGSAIELNALECRRKSIFRQKLGFVSETGRFCCALFFSKLLICWIWICFPSSFNGWFSRVVLLTALLIFEHLNKKFPRKKSDKKVSTPMENNFNNLRLSDNIYYDTKFQDEFWNKVFVINNKSSAVELNKAKSIFQWKQNCQHFCKFCSLFRKLYFLYNMCIITP